MSKSPKKENSKKDTVRTGDSKKDKPKSRKEAVASAIKEIEKKEKKDENETVVEAINSEIKLIVNKNNNFEVVVEGFSDKDKQNLEMNTWGSGSYNVEPAPVFGVIKRVNQILSVFKVKK